MHDRYIVARDSFFFKGCIDTGDFDSRRDVDGPACYAARNTDASCACGMHVDGLLKVVQLKTLYSHVERRYATL